MADLILPDASAFERFGFKPYSTNQGGLIGVRRPVVSPPGDARPWYDAEIELAGRLGLSDQYPWKTGEEWVTMRIAPGGKTLADFDTENPIAVTPAAPEKQYLEKGFPTPSGKVELTSGRFEALGLPALPRYQPPPESRERQPELAEDYPLIGTSRRPGAYIHTRYRTIAPLRRREPEACLRMHPTDASVRDIGDGDPVSVQSREGEVRLIARLTSDTKPGVVVADFGWGNPGDQNDNLNRLTSDDSRDPICAATPNRRFLCQVTRLG